MPLFIFQQISESIPQCLHFFPLFSQSVLSAPESTQAVVFGWLCVIISLYHYFLLSRACGVLFSRKWQYFANWKLEFTLTVHDEFWMDEFDSQSPPDEICKDEGFWILGHW